jgi:hypothetical protein
MLYEPLFAVPIILLLVMTALFWSRHMLEVTTVLAILPVAALVDFSAGNSVFSVTPPLAAAALVPAAAMVYLNRRPAEAPGAAIPQVYLPLLCFVFFAVISSILVPLLFEGKFQVALSMDQRGIVPLEWGRTNITQSGYLVFLTAFAIVVSSVLLRRPRAIQRVVDALIWSGYLAAAIAIYHFAAEQMGWYFPYQVFYSKPEVRTLAAFVRVYHVGGLSLRQAYGTFSEPSTLAQFMVGVAYGSWYWWLRGTAPFRVKLLAITSIVVLAMTFSTTAYVGLGAGGLLLVARLTYMGRVRSAMLLALSVLACVGAAVWVLSNQEVSGLKHFTDTVLDFVLLQKSQTTSYAIRRIVDQVALRGFVDTYGLGLGWGSTRGSSLLLHMLGNTGLIGILLLGWFAMRVRRQLRRYQATPVRGFIGLALCGNLLAGCIAVPDINSVTIWLLLGVLVAMAYTPRVYETLLEEVPPPAKAEELVLTT